MKDTSGMIMPSTYHRILTTLLLLALPTFGQIQAQEAPQPVTLNWVGCGISKKAYMEEIAALYEKRTGIKININGGGATKGIRQVSNGETDIGGTCRFTLDNHTDEKNATLVPVAWDALAVIAHPSNPVDNLSLNQVRAIYEGHVTNWKDVGGKDAPIQLLAREGKNSGVGRTIRQLVFANYEQEFSTAEMLPSSGPLEKAVEANENAIGITGISSARKRNVKIVKLEGKDPSYDNIASGDYLLYRPLYLAYKRDAANADQVAHFIQFVHGAEGQEVLRNNGTVPYLEAIHLVRKKIEQAKRARDRGL